jgi:hypothetical protein
VMRIGCDEDQSDAPCDAASKAHGMVPERRDAIVCLRLIDETSHIGDGAISSSGSSVNNTVPECLRRLFHCTT